MAISAPNRELFCYNFKGKLSQQNEDQQTGLAVTETALSGIEALVFSNMQLYMDFVRMQRFFVSFHHYLENEVRALRTQSELEMQRSRAAKNNQDLSDLEGMFKIFENYYEKMEDNFLTIGDDDEIASFIDFIEYPSDSEFNMGKKETLSSDEKMTESVFLKSLMLTGRLRNYHRNPSFPLVFGHLPFNYKDQEVSRGAKPTACMFCTHKNTTMNFKAMMKHLKTHQNLFICYQCEGRKHCSTSAFLTHLNKCFKESRNIYKS